MWGGNITNLAEDLGHSLIETPIGKGMTIYFNGPEYLIIKGDIPIKSLKNSLKNAVRKIKDHGKDEKKRSSDFNMVVSVDEGGAGLNLYNPKDWKKPIYDIVMKTVKHD